MKLPNIIMILWCISPQVAQSMTPQNIQQSRSTSDQYLPSFTSLQLPDPYPKKRKRNESQTSNYTTTHVTHTQHTAKLQDKHTEITRRHLLTTHFYGNAQKKYAK